MERYRLKNIIILILVLLNAFLLVSLGIRGTKEHTARRAQQQELVALFAADVRYGAVRLYPDPGGVS